MSNKSKKCRKILCPRYKTCHDKKECNGYGKRFWFIDGEHRVSRCTDYTMLKKAYA